ncbi:DedA family protein [Longibacter salinarum]|uniref:DedA family protein n=1 Tax=Longibacter salinarum TaxID=1850348 RepID=A0A2A8CWH5_9BACT|nr:DedA family protein [Longibacter salinarum]PEN12960.1 DedA family protein [Longibacter salinarum]
MEIFAELFSNFFDWMEALPAIWAYATLFIIAYGENVLPPIPGDMVVVFAGYMAGVGLLDLWLVILLSTIGGAAGFMSMYGIGYYVGQRALTSDKYRWLPRTGIEKAQRWLHEYGYGVVAANRFLSGARSVISLTVGAAQMRPMPTLGWSTFSAAVWCGLISTGGYFVGDNWRMVVEYVRAYGRGMLILLTTIAVILLIRWYLTRNRDASEEGPGSTQSDHSSDASSTS